MGLLTILKKMKQKEKEVRLLMLYPVNSPVVVAGAICAKHLQTSLAALPLRHGHSSSTPVRTLIS